MFILFFVLVGICWAFARSQNLTGTVIVAGLVMLTGLSLGNGANDTVAEAMGKTVLILVCIGLIARVYYVRSGYDRKENR